MVRERARETRKALQGRFRSARVRKMQYDYLVLRDGPRCIFCGISADIAELVIHHIDGNPANNDWNNLSLMCRSDNMKVIWRIKQQYPIQKTGSCDITISNNVRERDRAGVEGMDGERSTNLINTQNASEEIKQNLKKEPMYRAWIMERLIREGSIYVSTAINAGAEKVGISPLTARRYLHKMVSDEGPLTITAGKGAQYMVRIKAEYWEKLAADIGEKRPKE